MAGLKLFKCSGEASGTLILVMIIASYLLILRVVTTVVVTARNVMYALNRTPESTEAYESSDKILCIINDSQKAADAERGGTKKTVSQSEYCSINLRAKLS